MSLELQEHCSLKPYNTFGIDVRARLLAHARDNIPSRKLAATLSIVNMSLHKELRMVMVRKRALQLFVELGRIESQRADQAEYQRVAATGISRLCTNF